MLALARRCTRSSSTPARTARKSLASRRRLSTAATPACSLISTAIPGRRRITRALASTMTVTLYYPRGRSPVGWEPVRTTGASNYAGAKFETKRGDSRGLSVPHASLAVVLVVAAHPRRLRGALGAALGRAVQQGVIGHRGLEATGGRYIGPVDRPVRKR